MKVKKYSCLLLAGIMCALLCSCSQNTASQAESASDTSSAAESSQSDTVSEESSSADESASGEESEASDGNLSVDFSAGESPLFEKSNGWSNGDMFNCTWRASNVTFDDGKMQLMINLDGAEEGKYSGGEYRTKDFYGYGMYEVSMKPIKNDGVVSSFFTYTGPSDNNPWDEIDIEFLGKDTTKVQFNYFTNGVGSHEKLYDLGFDASEDFHTYGFKWSKDSITWYVDGKEVHTATESIPVTESKIMMNTWNGIGVDGWLNAYDGKTPLTAEYQWVKFTKE